MSKTRNLYSDILECTYTDCMAYIRQTATPKGEVNFHWHPHNENFPHAHSKCTESTCCTVESINVSEIASSSREDAELLILEDLDDDHFKHDFIPCKTNPKQLYHNGFIFTDMSKKRRGTEVFACIKRRNQKFGKCPAKAYGKEIDGKKKFAIDTFHTHARE